MAIALHLGETKQMDYQFQNDNHTKWANFLAWKILSVSPKFHPPSLMLTIMNDPSDATMVDTTAPPANFSGHQANHLAVVPSANHPVVPSMVVFLPCVAEMPMSSLILMEPTNMHHASGSLSISTMEMYLQSSKQVQNKVLVMSPPKLFPFSSATNTPLINLDPREVTDQRWATRRQKQSTSVNKLRWRRANNWN
jgi:hypothetical protein